MPSLFSFSAYYFSCHMRLRTMLSKRDPAICFIAQTRFKVGSDLKHLKVAPSFCLHTVRFSFISVLSGVTLETKKRFPASLVAPFFLMRWARDFYFFQLLASMTPGFFLCVFPIRSRGRTLAIRVFRYSPLRAVKAMGL